VHGRKGLSEVIGAFIVVVAVVAASIAVSAAMGKTTQRALEALEGASGGPGLAVVPVAAGPRLEVNVAPLQPGEQVTIMIVDSRGAILAEKTFRANSTIARLTVLEDYDCRPIYVIVVTSEGRVAFFDRRDLGMPVNETVDPRLYTCPANAGGVETIRDPITGSQAIVASLRPQSTTLEFEPIEETVIFTVGLVSSVRNYLGLETAQVSARIQTYVNGTLTPVGTVGPNQFLQVHQGKINVSVGVLYDETYDFAVIVARIDGPSDLYLVNATVKVSSTKVMVQSIPLGTPYFAAVPLLYGLVQDTTLYLLNYKDRSSAGYYYFISGNTKGYVLVGNSIVVGYASFYGVDITAGFRVTLRIIGEANYSLAGANHYDYYVGTAAPGEPITVSLESLAYKITSPTWHEAPATKLLEAAPLYPHTLQLILEAPDGKIKTLDIGFGNTTIVADDYYKVYVRVWETPPVVTYSSWNISITRQTDIVEVTTIWNGEQSKYPAINPTLPPWIVRANTANNKIIIIVAYTSTSQDGAAAYLTDKTPPGACTFPANPWQDPLTKWVPRTCNPPDTGTRLIILPTTQNAITITLAGEEILTIPFYEIRIFNSP